MQSPWAAVASSSKVRSTEGVHDVTQVTSIFKKPSGVAMVTSEGFFVFWTSTALHHDMIVVTRNTSDFDQFTDLTVTNPWNCTWQATTLVL